MDYFPDCSCCLVGRGNNPGHRLLGRTRVWEEGFRCGNHRYVLPRVRLWMCLIS